MIIAGMSIYQIFAYFLIYSLVGWLLEVTFHAVVVGIVTNRGFLNGPLCPVYGCGMVVLIGVTNTLTGGNTGNMNPLMSFICGLVLGTLAELIAGWVLDTIFHLRWWDYSDKPYNIGGYICLEFSLMWGVGGIVVMNVAHPIIKSISVDRIDPKYGWPIMAVCYMVFIVDLCVTVATINGFNKKLKELDEISRLIRKTSDAMTKTVAGSAMKTQGAVQETRLQATLARAELRDATEEKKRELTQTAHETYYAYNQKFSEYTDYIKMSSEQLQERYDKLMDSLTEAKTFGAGRLMRAFPKMEHHDYKEVVQSMLTKINSRRLNFHKDEKES